MAPGDVVFVVNPRGWEHAFKSPDGIVGRHMAELGARVLIRARATAPQPGVPPRNRTRINYATGELASSHIADIGVWGAGDVESRVIAMARHAAMVSKGTRPHEIKPRTAPRLVFFSPKKGGFVFAKKVDHPGTAANPYLYEALESVVKILR